MKLRNLVRNLSAALVLTTACGLVSFPLIAKASPIRVSDRATTEANQVVSVQAQQDYSFNQNNQTYFGIAPNGQPIVLDANYYNSNTNNTVEETATWERVADRVGKSDCLQNVYTGKVLCGEIERGGERLAVDRR
jgi:UDP-N-acetyl-D-mannosaminuronic acid transferase (WecB/TagA/CpsF family)